MSIFTTLPLAPFCRVEGVPEAGEHGHHPGADSTLEATVLDLDADFATVIIRGEASPHRVTRPSVVRHPVAIACRICGFPVPAKAGQHLDDVHHGVVAAWRASERRQARQRRIA
jgi:hypothetical protein